MVVDIVTTTRWEDVICVYGATDVAGWTYAKAIKEWDYIQDYEQRVMRDVLKL